jgi:phosphoribosyl 1,2-cyclic phosphodiesterase
MKLLPVGSSSSGNATYIFNDDTHILIDCGISAKRVLERTGRTSFDALFISHEHSDHITGAGPLARKIKVPLYMHSVVHQAKLDTLTNCTVNLIDETSVIQVGSFIIRPFSTKHDAKHSMGFVVEEPAAKVSLCYLTDTGSISKTMREQTKNCNAFFIECDYDEDLMEAYDGYDQLLKDRVTSHFGHLGTLQALEFLQSFDLEKIKAIVIGHISPRTNSPDKVKERINEKVAAYKDKFMIAPFDQPLQL